MSESPQPPVLIDLPDGRHLAVDDVGDPAGRPVIFLHGSPSCRLARPPLDAQVGAAGIRLLAFDRPGLGGSDPDPLGTTVSFAADVAVALDHLAVPRCEVLAWSAGAIWACALPIHPRLDGRIAHLTIAAGLVPAEAFDDPAVRAVASDNRGGLLDTVDELGPAETAELVAPMMVPYPCTADDARDHLATVRDPVEAAEIASVPGGTEQSVASLVATVRQGLGGVVHELTVQLSRSGLDLSQVTIPTRLVYGDADQICPPAFGQWFADQLANSSFEVLAGASHGLPFRHWLDLLDPPTG